jgi:hypothetical protein
LPSGDFPPISSNYKNTIIEVNKELFRRAKALQEKLAIEREELMRKQQQRKTQKRKTKRTVHMLSYIIYLLLLIGFVVLQFEMVDNIWMMTGSGCGVFIFGYLTIECTARNSESKLIRQLFFGSLGLGCNACLALLFLLSTAILIIGTTKTTFLSKSKCLLFHTHLHKHHHTHKKYNKNSQ